MVDSQGKVTKEVIESARAYVQLREAYGYLSEEDQALNKELTDLVQLYDEGKIALGSELDLMVDYAAELKDVTAEVESLADAKTKLAEETQRAIDKEKEHMSLLGKLFPKGMTEKEWTQYLPMLESMRGVPLSLQKVAVDIPRFTEAGTVPGPLGRPVSVIAEGGEMFLGSQKGSAALESTINLTLTLDGETVSRVVSRHLGKAYMARSRMGG